MNSVTDSIWFKIGLAMVPILGICIVTWADVRSMKAERAVITDGRLVKLEVQTATCERELTELKSQIGRLWSRRREER